MPLRAGISTVAVYRADPINWGREIKRYLPLPIFVMGSFLCGVPCRGSHGSALNGVGSETAAVQMSQHVRRGAERGGAPFPARRVTTSTDDLGSAPLHVAGQTGLGFVRVGLDADWVASLHRLVCGGDGTARIGPARWLGDLEAHTRNGITSESRVIPEHSLCKTDSSSAPGEPTASPAGERETRRTRG